MIILWEFPGRNGLSLSPFTNKVRFALAFKGLPYQNRVLLSSRNSLTHKLPVLEYEGVRIHDSTEIIRFLEARHPDPPLIPAGRAEKALAHIVEEWADEALNPILQHQRGEVRKERDDFIRVAVPSAPELFVPLLSAFRHRGRKKRFAYFIALGPEVVNRQLERHFDALDAMLEARPYFAGDSLSAADLAVAAPLSTMLGCGEPSGLIPAVDLLRQRPRLVSWFDRVLMRVWPERSRFPALLSAPIPSGGEVAFQG